MEPVSAAACVTLRVLCPVHEVEARVRADAATPKTGGLGIDTNA